MENKRDYWSAWRKQKRRTVRRQLKAYRKLAKNIIRTPTPVMQKQKNDSKKSQKEAYAVLGDEKRKKLYDEFGHTRLRARASKYGCEKHKNNMDMKTSAVITARMDLSGVPF